MAAGALDRDGTLRVYPTRTRRYNHSGPSARKNSMENNNDPRRYSSNRDLFSRWLSDTREDTSGEDKPLTSGARFRRTLIPTALLVGFALVAIILTQGNPFARPEWIDASDVAEHIGERRLVQMVILAVEPGEQEETTVLMGGSARIHAVIDADAEALSTASSDSPTQIAVRVNVLLDQRLIDVHVGDTILVGPERIVTADDGIPSMTLSPEQSLSLIRPIELDG